MEVTEQMAVSYTHLKKNTFSIEAFLDHRLKLKPGDKYEVVETDRVK